MWVSSSYLTRPYLLRNFESSMSLVVGIPSWSGIQAASQYGETWDCFAKAWMTSSLQSRNPIFSAQFCPSLTEWVKRQANGLTDGQKPFERALLLRQHEIVGNYCMSWTELPFYVRSRLEAANLGEMYWSANASHWHYASPY